MTRHWIRRRVRVLSVGAGCAGMVLAAVLVALTPSAGAAAELVVQAEAYSAQSGGVVEPTVDTGGGSAVGYLSRVDWLRYDGVDLGVSGTMAVSVRVASAVGGTGTVQLRTGS